MEAKRRFTIVIQEDPEGGYTGRCLELHGAISEGETIEELKKNMTESIELVLESLEEDVAGHKKTSHRDTQLKIKYRCQERESAVKQTGNFDRF